MLIKRLLVSVFLLTLMAAPSISAQQRELDDNYLHKVYPLADYLNDLDELVERLVTLHPQPYAFITEAEFDQLVAEKKRSLNNHTTLGEYIWMYSSIIASIGCGHSSLSYFNQEDNLLSASQRFPLEARFIGDKLYITDPLINADKVSPGDQITSINGQSVATVQQSIYAHIGTDGHIRGYKQELANAYFTAYVAYSFQFPDLFTVRLNNSNGLIPLENLLDYQYKPIISPNNDCQQSLCLKILANEDVAVMTIRSTAYYENLDTFKAYVDKSFSTIKSGRGINNLILDFRGNHGGSSQATSYLLKQFANKAFTYFSQDTIFVDEQLKQAIAPTKERYTGKVYILVDGGTLSATGHFLSLIKANQLATLVGEESGSTFTCNDKSKHFKATHTGITYKIATATYSTPANDFPNSRGIFPDHEVVPGIDDYLNDRDPVMTYTLELIEQSTTAD